MSCFGCVGGAVCLQALNGLFEQLAVEIETHGSNMAALFNAQDVARAADFQVAQRELEARTEVRVAADRGKTLSGIFRQHTHRRQQQIRVGLAMMPADTAAQLVEFGEPEAVRAINMMVWRWVCQCHFQ